MFRKEQIWFVHKDSDGVYVYSLAILLPSRAYVIRQILWKNTEKEHWEPSRILN